MKAELRVKEYPGMEVYTLYAGNLSFASISISQGEISDIWVDPRWQRRGWATWLWEKTGRPAHSTTRTPEGHAWALSTGTHVPEKNTYDAEWENDS